MIKKILNPNTGRLVNVNGKIGQNLLSQYNSQKGGNITWARSLQMARKNLGITHFEPIKKGSKLYNETKKIYTNSNNRVLYGGSGCVPRTPPPPPQLPRLLVPTTDTDIPITEKIQNAAEQLRKEGSKVDRLRILRDVIKEAEQANSVVENSVIQSRIKSINEILEGASQKFKDWRKNQYGIYDDMMQEEVLDRNDMELAEKECGDEEMKRALDEHHLLEAYDRNPLKPHEHQFENVFDQHIVDQHIVETNFIPLLEELNILFDLDASGGQSCGRQ